MFTDDVNVRELRVFRSIRILRERNSKVIITARRPTELPFSLIAVYIRPTLSFVYARALISKNILGVNVKSISIQDRTFYFA